MPVILAGDVGGTKTLLGLFRTDRGEVRSLREASYPSQSAPDLTSMVRAFLEGERVRPSVFVVGVAGPVLDGRSHVVNVPWSVDQAELADGLGFRTVRVLNDLEATAWGIATLRGRQTVRLTPSLRPK